MIESKFVAEAGGKRLLLLMPSFHGYEDRVLEAAEAARYETLRFDERMGNSVLIKLLTRLGVIQRIKPLMRSYLARLIGSAVEFDPDIVLVINAETLNAESVAKLRKALPRARFLIYMWDSSSKKNITREMYAQFDRAYSFDPEDCKRLEFLQHIPLFHLHNENGWSETTSEAQHFRYDCTFIGTVRIRRMVILAAVAKQLSKLGKQFYFYLYAPSIGHYLLFRLLKIIVAYPGILSRKSVPYETYLKRIGESASCIDIEQSQQKGLTMRTLEVVFAGRPLLTTNRWAKRYDFYDQFPVSVFEPGKELEIPSGQPGRQAAKLFQKYSLKNWLETILSEREVSYLIEPLDKAANGPAAKSVGNSKVLT